ncbi:MAG: hypothetical protein MJE77_44390 [Proteobacteria bacterium]|nr:hypothetical protein [Pseudomonadota bacterium]
MGRWHGIVLGNKITWLRWYTAEGAVAPTAEESATARADQEAGQADEAAERVRALEQKLCALGIDPDEGI